jgi:hypothetical protein
MSGFTENEIAAELKRRKRATNKPSSDDDHERGAVCMHCGAPIASGTGNGSDEFALCTACDGN